MSLVTHQHTTALGEIWSQWSTRGLYRIELQRPIDADLTAIEQLEPKQLDRQLIEFAKTGCGTFEDVIVDPDGWTDFSVRVYDACRQIAPGQTLTYKKLASKAGNDQASRAVGAAMARNRVLLVIPCHRVIASNGQLRGFSAPGGLETKRRLLDLEQSGNHARQMSLLNC